MISLQNVAKRTPPNVNKSQKLSKQKEFFEEIEAIEIVSKMPIISTPASPTPYADEGEELMLVLRDFISATLSFAKNPENPDYSGVFIERNSDKALRLLKQMPVAKDAVFEYFALVIGLLMSQEFGKSRQISQSLVSSVEKLHFTLMEFIKHPALGKKFPLNHRRD